jgi:hypothetical protein
LGVIGAGKQAEVAVESFNVSPAKVKLGERVTLALTLRSTAKRPQKLVVDYAVHYVKHSGGTSAKVFKWKETTVGSGEVLELAKSQRIQDFTTRKHHSGKHVVEVMVNGDRKAGGVFVLATG